MVDRSLESALYNKANELQDEISVKKYDLRVAQMQLAAVRAQVKCTAVKIASSFFFFFFCESSRLQLCAAVSEPGDQCGERGVGPRPAKAV